MIPASLPKVLALALCFIFVGCSAVERSENRPEYEVIVVRIPPLHDPSLTPLQNYYVFQHFLYPVPGGLAVKQIRGDTGTWDVLPHDDSLLHVTLSEAGEISINTEPQASLDAAADRLSGIFSSRQEMGVYAPGSDRVVKAVGIRIRKSAKYSELVRVAAAVKKSGADPVVLLLDGHLPNQVIEASGRINE